MDFSSTLAIHLYHPFKPVKLRLKIDLVSYPARAEGLVYRISIIIASGRSSTLHPLIVQSYCR